MLGKTEGKRRGRQKIKWLDSITNSMDVNLSKLGEIVKDREDCMLHPWDLKETGGHHSGTEQQKQASNSIRRMGREWGDWISVTHTHRKEENQETISLRKGFIKIAKMLMRRKKFF